MTSQRMQARNSFSTKGHKSFVVSTFMAQVLDRKGNKPLSTDVSISICNHWSTGAMGEAPHPSGAPLVRSRLLADEITVVTHALRQHAVVYILGPLSCSCAAAAYWLARRPGNTRSLPAGDALQGARCCLLTLCFRKRPWLLCD